MGQRLEHRAKAFLALAERRLGLSPLINVAKRHDKAAIRGRINVEPDPTVVKRQSLGLQMRRAPCFQHSSIGLVCLASDYARKHFEDPMPDDFLCGLAPELDRFPVSEKKAFLGVEGVDRLPDRVEHF
jgi:hypothetical protein